MTESIESCRRYRRPHGAADRWSRRPVGGSSPRATSRPRTDVGSPSRAGRGRCVPVRTPSAAARRRDGRGRTRTTRRPERRMLAAGPPRAVASAHDLAPPSRRSRRRSHPRRGVARTVPMPYRCRGSRGAHEDRRADRSRSRYGLRVPTVVINESFGACVPSKADAPSPSA